MTKKIIRLLVVDKLITDHSQILFHCGDVHRANGVECNIRRITVLRSCPNETHCMRMKEWPILMKDTILPSASTAMRD